jgi:hypothetical protein
MPALCAVLGGPRTFNLRVANLRGTTSGCARVVAASRINRIRQRFQGKMTNLPRGNADQSSSFALYVDAL